MKIVILDAYSVNPGDLSWKGLEELADVEIYDRTDPEEIVQRCKGAEIILTNKVVLDASVLGQLPRLMYIGVLATGYNVVDLEVASRQSIVVTNIPSYSTDSVVQMTWAHILNMTNSVNYYARHNRKGKWCLSHDFCYWDAPIHELAGKNIGIVGLGNIGSKVAATAYAFGMNVLAVTSKRKENLPEWVEAVDMDELLERSDVVTLHCPLTASNAGMVNAEFLGKMKKSALLINTGRGGLVNEQEVADALNDGVIAGYGTDVASQEPMKSDNPLLFAKNCFVTPHIAWATVEARTRLIEICVENVRAFLANEPINQVN